MTTSAPTAVHSTRGGLVLNCSLIGTSAYPSSPPLMNTAAITDNFVGPIVPSVGGPDRSDNAAFPVAHGAGSDLELGVVPDDGAGVESGEEVGDLPSAGDDRPGVDLVPRDEDEGALMGARMRQYQLRAVVDTVAHHDQIDVERPRSIALAPLAPERRLDGLRP